MADFQDYGIHSQINDIWVEKKTGVLNCEVKGFEKALFFKEGVVVFASSNDPEDKLHRVLIHQEKISEHLQTWLARQKNKCIWCSNGSCIPTKAVPLLRKESYPKGL